MHKNVIDLTGQKFGHLTVLNYSNYSIWLCRCDCGKKIAVHSCRLRNGTKTSCGCKIDQILPLPLDKSNDLTGQKFGRLTVLNHLPVIGWLCKCDCGKEIYVFSWKSLKSGRVKACKICERIIKSRKEVMERRTRQKRESLKVLRYGDLTGQKFGHLTVTEYIRYNKWLCKCDCGVETTAHGAALKNGIIISCGCVKPKNDLIGQKFGHLTVIAYIFHSKWHCHCDCGVETTAYGAALRNGTKTSCGCIKPKKKKYIYKTNKFDIALIGQKFGFLTALKYLGKQKWLCKCDCGNEKIVSTGNLNHGKTKSCGCLQQKSGEKRAAKNHGMTLIEWKIYKLKRGIKKLDRQLDYPELPEQARHFIDLAGQKFNRLTVLRYAGKAKWLCRCDCGTVKKVNGAYLRTGRTKSCGCLQRESRAKQGAKNHGMTLEEYKQFKIKRDTTKTKTKKGSIENTEKITASRMKITVPQYREWKKQKLEIRIAKLQTQLQGSKL